MSKFRIDNDRYEFDDVDILGRGGFGVVYRGHDRRLNRPVAVKAIHPHLLADPAFANRFQQEAQTLAGLDDHPAIVNVYDVVVQDGQLYIVMACVPGQTLKQVCQSHAPLSPAQAIAILRPLAGALDFAHQRGLLHRDVKPGNVLLTADHKPVLIDFGLARALEQSTRFTRSGSTFGSPAYMAPEQVDPNRRDQVGPAADLYALGIVAYELLAGRVPFPGSDNATLYAHEHKAPPSPRQYRPNLPPAMEQAILKMLAKRPAERYATCAEFVDALEQAAQPRPWPVIPPPPAAPRRPGGLSRWLWVAIGAVVLVLLLYGGALLAGLFDNGDEDIAAVQTGQAITATAQAAALFTDTPTPTPTSAPTSTVTPAAAPPDTASPSATVAATATPTEPLPTATSAATNTPRLPTATVTPLSSFVVATQSVNTRSGPGTNYPVVGTLFPNDPKEVVGRNETGDWWQLQLEENRLVWVAGSVVDSQNSDAVPVVVTPTPPPATSTPEITSTVEPAALPTPRLISPTPGANFQKVATFIWGWDGPELAETQAFEVRIWQSGSNKSGAHDACLDRNKLDEPGENKALTVNDNGNYVLNISDITSAAGVEANGDYLWTVAVIECLEDNGIRDINQAEPPIEIEINPFGNGGPNGNGGPSKATPPNN